MTQEYIITEFQLKQLQDFASLEFVCQAIMSRPHPSAPEPLPKPEIAFEDFRKIWNKYMTEHDAAIARAATLAALRKDGPKLCPYCGSGSMNKSELCGPNHPPIFNGYYCTWCGTSFDDNMIILAIGHDHENSVEYERKKRAMKAWDYEATLRQSTTGDIKE